MQKLLDDPNFFPDGGGGAAAAHLGDDGTQPKRAYLEGTWEGQLWARQEQGGVQGFHLTTWRELAPNASRNTFADLVSDFHGL